MEVDLVCWGNLGAAMGVPFPKHGWGTSAVAFSGLGLDTSTFFHKEVDALITHYEL